jgi:hypothetical protein
VKTPLDITSELVRQGLGEFHKVYTGGSEFETYFIYTGESPVTIGDLTLNTGDMYDLTYWSYDG